MKGFSAAVTVKRILAMADVRVNASRPWDLLVNDDRFYSRLLAAGAVGLGESYVEGWWDCEGLSEFFYRVLRVRLDRKAPVAWAAVWARILNSMRNRQGRIRSTENARRHYDLGNDLYCTMLGKWMLYSSADWGCASTLSEAGEAKLDSVCRSLGLQPGQKILDIGCGWGGLAKYAAENYCVEVVGITLSREQADLARQICSDLPVEIRIQDYRDLDEKFDRIASLGMFEHVGHTNYRRYMEIVRRCLKPDGLFFLNTIGVNHSRERINSWTEKYIFPGGVLPSLAQIGAAIDGLFVIEELNDRADFYDRTLVAWFENFQANWASLRDRYGERFFRMWKYYLLSSAGAFRCKAVRDWRILLSPCC
jgi:cyclopropane-fatty-acyl-phospholipid synthase